MITIIILIYGLLIGSFLNLCIHRIPRGESIMSPPSHCGLCKHRLNLRDLIPILSYLTLRGRCRYCKLKISPRYLIMEIFTAMIFGVIYQKYGLGFEFFKYIFLSCFMIVIGLIDFDTQDIYTVTTYSGILIGVIFAVLGKLFYGYNLVDNVIGIIVSLTIFWGIYFFLGGMGAGDIEMAVLGGVFLGFKLTILMIFLAITLGGIIASGLIIFKKASKGNYIAFGPYLAFSCFIVILAGDLITKTYLNIF